MDKKILKASFISVRKSSLKDVRNRVRKWLLKEEYTLANPNYFEDIQYVYNSERRFRRKVAYWVFCFEDEFDVEIDTILLALSLFDRVLSIVPIKIDHLQLLALSCVLCATKLKEVKPFDIKHLTKFVEGSYSIKDILEYEELITTTLDFKLESITSIQFLQVFLICYKNMFNNVNFEVFADLATILLEYTFYETKYLKYKPSELALCVLNVLSKIFKKVLKFQSDVTQNFNINLNLNCYVELTKYLLVLYSNDVYAIEMTKECYRIYTIDDDKENIDPNPDFIVKKIEKLGLK